MCVFLNRMDYPYRSRHTCLTDFSDTFVSMSTT